MLAGPLESQGRDPDTFGQELEACRSYLMLVAERAIPTVLRIKLAPSDLIQETFVDARRRVSDLRASTPDELRSWLYRVMMLNLAEQRRKYFGTAKADIRREVRLDGPRAGTGREKPRDQLVDDHPTPSAAAMGREQLARLARGLSELPERDRQVILLRYREGLTFAEIGRRLGSTEDGARKGYGRACRRLRDRLGDELL